MKLRLSFCLLLLCVFTFSTFAQTKIRVGTKIGVGAGKYKPILQGTSNRFQRANLIGLGSAFVDDRIRESNFYIRYELGFAKRPTPSDYMIDADVAISTQLLWQSESGWAFGAGLRAALVLSIMGETSLFVYQRSAHELAIPLSVEKHWALGDGSAINLGVMSQASLTRVFRDCLWWDNPFDRATNPCVEQAVRGGLIYVGFLYQL